MGTKAGLARGESALRTVARAAGVVVFLVSGAVGSAQDAVPRERILVAGREIMKGAAFATLITVDAAGRAQARTVEPFEPEGEMVVWIGTNPRTRKVAELRRDPRVTLHYFDPKVQGYATLQGTATLVNDRAEKAARFKPGWAAFYPDRERDYLLIRVNVERLEVVSPNHGISGDSLRWRPPALQLRPPR